MKTVALLVGLPGSGKSTLLRTLRQTWPWPVVDRDGIRKAMFPTFFDNRIEKDAANLAVWSALEAHLGVGHDVFIDGMTFASQGNRDRAAAIAVRHGACLRQLWMDVPVGEAARRIGGQPDHPSPERVPTLAAEVAARFAPLTGDYLRLDATLPVTVLAAAAAAWLAPSAPSGG